MDLKTLSAILSQQIQDSVNMGASIQQLAFTVSQLVNQENSTAEVNPQVKALMGTASILMQSLNSQNVLVQQTIDSISQIVS